jgi:hypothetical protein
MGVELFFGDETRKIWFIDSIDGIIHREDEKKLCGKRVGMTTR